jgi:glycosyltransferase involved in cell wall biosynthesis
LLTLARGLRTRGHRQTIVCPPDSALAERAREEGFSVAAKVVREGDIVHAHSGRAQNTAYRATVGSHLRRVVTRHVAFPPRCPWVHRLKYSMTCHGIIAVSESVREALMRAGVPAKNVRVVHTGVELPPPQARRAASNDFVIGHMGAFTPEKGQEVILAAAGELRTSLPRARFILAGEGPRLAGLRRGAPSTVSFPGFVGDHAAFFAGLDLFVMPSRSEAWGLAALEAMAHGVPVIASNIGGLREIVEHGRSGWLVPPGDAAALARAITAAARDPARLREAGMAARERAAQFSVERMAEETERFYYSLLRPSSGVTV